MALWIRNAGTYTLQGASGNIGLVGASKTKSFYTTDKVFCYSSNSNVLTGPHTWSSANATTFPLLSHTQSSQYDPSTDTYLRNNNGQISEYDTNNTLIRSMSITNIPQYNSHDGVITSLTGEKFIYYLVKATGELYQLNRNLIGTPVFVTTISPVYYQSQHALGGFYHQDFLYMINRTGTELQEISIQTGQPTRVAATTVSGLKCSYPMVSFAASQVIGTTHFFTLSDLNGTDFIHYEITLKNRNPQTPNIVTPDGTSTSPGIHDVQTAIRWSFFDLDERDLQSAYQLEITEVATDTIIYDSGKVKGLSNFFYTYTISLKIHELYKWRVRAWDYYDAESQWSRYAYFKTNQRPTVFPLTGVSHVTFHQPILGLTPRLHFRFTDPDNDPIREIYIKINRLSDFKEVLNRRFTPDPQDQYFDVPANILERGTTYYWTLNGFDAYGAAFYTNWTFFITTASAAPPMPLSPVHQERTTLQPSLVAELAIEQSGLSQHFQLDLSELPNFSVVRTYRTDESQAGWEAHNGKEWVPFPAKGVKKRTQYVQNASFEQSDTIGKLYNDWGTDGITVDDIFDLNAPPHTGSRAVRLIQQRPVLSQLKLSQGLSGIRPGERLRVNATVNVVRIAPGAEVSVQLSGTNFTHKGIVITERSSAYKSYSFEIVVPSNYWSSMQIDFAIKGAGYTECWLDALTVEAADVPSYQFVRFQPPEPLAPKVWYWRIASYNNLTKGEPLRYSTDRQLSNLLPLNYTDGGSGKSDYSVWDLELEGDASETSLMVEYPQHPEDKRAIHAVNQKPNANLSLIREYDSDFESGKYYLFLADMKSTYADCYIEFGEYKSATLQKPDLWETLWFKMPGKTAVLDYLKFHISPKEIGQHTYIANPRVYEISEMEYAKIGVDPLWSGFNLNTKYPFVDGTAYPSQSSSFRSGDVVSVALKKPIQTTAPANTFTMNAVCTIPSSRVSEHVPGISGNLRYAGTPVYKDGVITFMNDPNAYVKLQFTGTGIRWHGIKNADSCIASVLIDDRIAGQVDLYADSSRQEMLYECLNLPYGLHTITVKASQFSNPASTGTKMLTVSSFETIVDQKPGKFIVEACNNGFDEQPAWEDVTAIVTNGGKHVFANQNKTAAQWGVSTRLTILANGTFSPAMLDGFGFSFE
ncbi:hypothetical protein EDM56_11945 [Brevibacillus fluminis]|uniref:Uncharacterized protein n=1 Tax=Brevibacillus fluminis TaxID=511487 RepID=A0A3M8DP19_9BACL|nr:hypothetical protein [Brevibacillus fluminis]RNB89863.1 hypothetical protein EDM56_11945 [Brevibacillus fluminis]